MSIRPFISPGRTVAVTVAGGALLVGVLGGVAAADPPSLDADPCAQRLAAAGVWPGTAGDDDRYRLVSDAFDSYLSRQPECTRDLATR